MGNDLTHLKQIYLNGDAFNLTAYGAYQYHICYGVLNPNGGPIYVPLIFEISMYPMLISIPKACW